MLSWLKFTFGAFFSNYEARNGAKRSLWNVVFHLFLALIILISFFSGAVNYTFASHYENASNLKNTLYSLFANDSENQYNIKLLSKDESTGLGYIKVFNKYDLDGDEIIIDTISLDSTSFTYAIDSRDPDAYTYFTVDNGVVTNTKLLLELDDTLDAAAKSYLAEYQKNEEADSTLTSEYSTLLEEYQTYKNNNQTDKEEYYKKAFYDLYIRSMYAGVITETPTLRDYYQDTYCAIDDSTNDYVYDNIFIMLKDWFFTTYSQDDGRNYYFYGFYNDLDDDFVLYDSTTNQKEIVQSQIDSFIKNVFNSSSGNRSIVIAIQTFTFFPYFFFAMLILCAILFLIFKIKHIEYASKFRNTLLIVSSFLIVSCSIAGIASIIFGIILPPDGALNIGFWSAILVWFLRCSIFMIVELIKNKIDPKSIKLVNEKKEITQPTQFFDDSKEIENLDIASAKSEIKVIENENVNEDDDEKMELL